MGEKDESAGSAAVAAEAGTGGGTAVQAATDELSAFFTGQILEGMKDLAARSLQFLWPDKIVGCPPVGKYDAAMHGRISLACALPSVTSAFLL